MPISTQNMVKDTHTKHDVIVSDLYPPQLPSNSQVGLTKKEAVFSHLILLLSYSL